jgi:2-amino-4-hydroxy-6-hydroxymethyldihydropteridine diphosphokinase
MEKQRPDQGFHLAMVGMGSNEGNREATLSAAIQTLAGKETNHIKAVSSLYETEPFGKTDQAWFLNCIIHVETSLSMKSFFHNLQDVETLFHRKRGEHWGPRTLDLDLLFFDDIIFSDSELTVPHPGIQERRFVLEPLFELTPDLIHPSMKLPVRALLEKLSDPCRVIRIGRLPSV